MYRGIDFRKTHYAILIGVGVMLAGFWATDWNPSEGAHQAIVMGAFLVGILSLFWLYRDEDREAREKAASDPERDEARR